MLVKDLEACIVRATVHMKLPQKVSVLNIMLLNKVFVTQMKSSLVSAFCLSIAREHQNIAWNEQNRIEVSETFT